MDWRKPSPEQVAAFEAALPRDPRVERAQMFGMPCGKVGEYVFSGLHHDGVTVRLPAQAQGELLRQSGVKHFEPMAGRPMKDWVLLPAGWLSDERLGGWIRRAFEHAAALPPKAKPRPKKAAARRPR